MYLVTCDSQIYACVNYTTVFFEREYVQRIYWMMMIVIRHHHDGSGNSFELTI